MIAPIVAAAALHLTPPDYTHLDNTVASNTRRETRITWEQRQRRHRARLRGRVVAWAASRIGMPYLWGAAGPRAFDCSGLVQWSYDRIGRHLPRTTWRQRSAGIDVLGHPLKRGDLVLAYGDSHVAIYAGHGTVIVAPHAGDVVKREPLSWLPISAIRRIIHRA